MVLCSEGMYRRVPPDDKFPCLRMVRLTDEQRIEAGQQFECLFVYRLGWIVNVTKCPPKEEFGHPAQALPFSE